MTQSYFSNVDLKLKPEEITKIIEWLAQIEGEKPITLVQFANVLDVSERTLQNRGLNRDRVAFETYEFIFQRIYAICKECEKKYPQSVITRMIVVTDEVLALFQENPGVLAILSILVRRLVGNPQFPALFQGGYREVAQTLERWIEEGITTGEINLVFSLQGKKIPISSKSIVGLMYALYDRAAFMQNPFTRRAAEDVATFTFQDLKLFKSIFYSTIQNNSNKVSAPSKKHFHEFAIVYRNGYRFPRYQFSYAPDYGHIFVRDTDNLTSQWQYVSAEIEDKQILENEKDFSTLPSIKPPKRSDHIQDRIVFFSSFPSSVSTYFLEILNKSPFGLEELEPYVMQEPYKEKWETFEKGLIQKWALQVISEAGEDITKTSFI